MKPLLFDVKSLLNDSIYVKEIDTLQLEDQFHFHNAYEIAYIIKSHGKRIIGDSIENFTHGDLVLLGLHVPHVSYFSNEQGAALQALVIYFNPDWLTEEHLNSPNLTKLRKLLKDLQRGIKVHGPAKKKVIKLLYTLKNGKGLERIITILSILQIISNSGEYKCLASEGYSSSYHQTGLKRMDQIYKYVLENFTETIKLEKIAAIANITPTSFCKYFKSNTKKTFSNFVNEIRIGYACKLLCNEDSSISEVGFKCGFNTLANFNRTFKQITRMAPSEYKNKIKL
ncbi:AraC family transcriptional regulator [Flavisolibacter ginsenosidimutans]|uniref:Helix-turn-helix domain-containing protein n=1 Tax=Flavisolibacter ginsenosidimutans TaxID=661481 RepID=A0A5B8UPK7_9BACT|nr:AraC family transcriptional regulator [Flavisolibacter ginsenosidimutans]QEC58386.1 helix-turn-helix domain-containing protein [Flavisolibacter ginsenosidimutans]